MTTHITPTAQRRGAMAIIAVAAVLLLGTLTALVFVNSDHQDPAADSDQPLEIGHIHGIAETADELLIGAHYGVFSVDSDGAVRPHGDRRSDTMAIAAVGNRLLASGHPSPDDRDAPANAGLLTSTDDAITWEVAALEGQADFHALDGTESRTWGIDSVAGLVLTSDDDQTWQPVAEARFIDLAVDPSNEQRVFATTDTGELVRLSMDGTLEPIVSAPVITLIDSSPDGELVGVGADGQVWASPDGGGLWIQQLEVPGDPTALTVTAQATYIATTDGLYRSGGADQAFERLFAIEHTA